MNIAKKGFVLFGMALIGACLSAVSHAKSIDWNWKDECVGRYQLSVPGDIEYPIAPYKDLISNSHPFYQFSDKAPARFHEINGGDILIGDGTKPKNFDLLRDAIAKNAAKLRDDQLEINNKIDADHIAIIPLKISDAFARRFKEAIELVMLRNNIIFEKSFYSHEKKYEEQLVAMHEFINSFRLRSSYEMPTTSGVCIPFAFMQDDGKISRDISANLRPQSHPDVMITFEDNEYILNNSDLDSNKKALIAMMLDYDSSPPHSSLAHIHPQTIDGREGAAGFFHLTRPNGQKDFLYLAVIKGTGNDNPSLVLRIERVAEYAKNQPPISESEFKALARHIVESIRPRSVSNAHSN
jgi:hypothetical protein